MIRNDVLDYKIRILNDDYCLVLFLSFSLLMTKCLIQRMRDIFFKKN